jgi:hypothetical protein
VASDIPITAKETGPDLIRQNFEKNLKKAESGDKSAQFEVGKSYSFGVGTPKNYKQAYIWFSLAAAQGHEKAKAKQNDIEKKLTPEQLGAAQDLALYKQLAISKQNEMKPVIIEKSVAGKFIATATEGDLFIVTGRIKNPTAHTISHVKLKGTLLTTGNIEAMDRTVLCGNTIDEANLKKMKIAQIERQLMDKNNSIKLGESSPFMIVFSNLPDDLKNFTVALIDFQKQPDKELKKIAN